MVASRAIIPITRGLVRRAAVVRYLPAAKRARIIYGMAQAGWQNRHRIRWAARRIQRFVRNRSRVRRMKRNAKRAIGSSVNANSAKKHSLLTPEPVLYATRTQYYTELTNITPTTTSAINERERHAINISGWGLKMYFRNNTTQPMTINFAVVSPKNGKVVSTDGWCRDYTNSRDVNLDTVLSSIKYNNLPISTDKWHVLSHRKFQLGPLTGSASWNFQMANNARWLNFYQPLKRQINYNDDAGTDAENPVFAVWYADFNIAAANTAQSANAYEAIGHFIGYFREPRA